MNLKYKAWRSFYVTFGALGFYFGHSSEVRNGIFHLDHRVVSQKILESGGFQFWIFRLRMLSYYLHFLRDPVFVWFWKESLQKNEVCFFPFGSVLATTLVFLFYSASLTLAIMMTKSLHFIFWFLILIHFFSSLQNCFHLTTETALFNQNSLFWKCFIN